MGAGNADRDEKGTPAHRRPNRTLRNALISAARTISWHSYEPCSCSVAHVRNGGASGACGMISAMLRSACAGVAGPHVVQLEQYGTD